MISSSSISEDGQLFVQYTSIIYNPAVYRHDCKLGRLTMVLRGWPPQGSTTKFAQGGTAFTHHPLPLERFLVSCPLDNHAQFFVFPTMPGVCFDCYYSPFEAFENPRAPSLSPVSSHLIPNGVTPKAVE